MRCCIFLGPTSDYLAFPTGEPTKDLTVMARQGLRIKVRAACHRILRGETVAEAPARVLRDGKYVPCLITVKPVSESREADGLLLVTFRDRKTDPATEGITEAEAGKKRNPHWSSSWNTN